MIAQRALFSACFCRQACLLSCACSWLYSCANVTAILAVLMDELGVFRMLLVANGDIKVVRSTVALMFISQIDEMVYRSCRCLFLCLSAPLLSMVGKALHVCLQVSDRVLILNPKLNVQCPTALSDVLRQTCEQHSFAPSADRCSALSGILRSRLFYHLF